MNNILFQTTNLSVGYGSGPARKVLFHDLSLSLRAGELVCFMGSNGVGKSTLIRTLANLQPALNNRGLRRMDPTLISVVLTDRVQAMNMTVRDLVSYGRYPYVKWHASLSSEDLEQVDLALEQLHLSDLAMQSIRELSDGQLQMVMIARALAQQTSIMLLDEPTAHLDLNNRLLIMNSLRRVAREAGKAILVSTHELDLALQMADRLWLADDKKIVTGFPEDLVLDGSLDRIFQFKGFDLKTGRVFHEAHRSIKVNLRGSGYRHLWAKNALERCGYGFSDEGIVVDTKEDGWETSGKAFQRIHDLVLHLEKPL